MWQWALNIDLSLVCKWTSGFYTGYGHSIFRGMQRDCIHKSCPLGPFLLDGTQWLNDSASVGCFLVDVCGLPRSCSSHSEQQVSRCDTCLCLRWWNKLDRGLWKRRWCLLKNGLFACCQVVVFVSLWKVNAGGRAEPTMNYGRPWQVKEKIDFHSFKSS